MGCTVEGSNGVHDCTKGPVCACGWKNEIPRFGFSLDIFDNRRPGMNKNYITEGFMTDHITVITEALSEIVRRIENETTD